MRIIIVGLGVQGLKRKKILSITNNFVVGVDPYSKNADYKLLSQVPLGIYDSCFLCVPDHVINELINYCLVNKKHVLIEKPLMAKNKKEILDIQKKAKKNNLVVYTAYNHRFEPHLERVKK